MQKIIMALFVVYVLAGCAGLQTLPPGQQTVKVVLEAPGMTKEQIYTKSKLWIARNLKPHKAVWLYTGRTAPVLEYASAEEGVLIATGNIFYPSKSYSLTEGYKNYWEVTFTMEEDIRDGKARVTFSNLIIYVPRLWCQNVYGGWMGAYDKPLTAAEDMAAVRPVLTGMADQLGVFLRSPETGENW